ncbi:NADH-quinone oxidoreductase subunit E [Roseovarius aestuarii]|uniref:NADH-quinone oxidoreductase chain 2 n=1 Tax=Roseovarius aestuarii TaxID=475083 RepID=A0A1X7BMQ1_9RHOB|nr:NADH-quinone oxidoreductase subunit E [Roseovarius aestuarii]SMC10881.1 NADH-quinone oxidoreductase chain 2 [Roseovarius aestuarii]
MLRRLHHKQPESFAFTPANREWADAQISKYPEGRQASAIIPLLWRAQEQEGWLSRPAIETVADMLGLAYIRALEVASFYFMFQLQPVGSVANIQICGTTSCMICGAEDLVGVCREKIADKPHTLSGDGKFSWEEVECLGACANAPMAQIGKDYYEDLTAARLAEIIDELAAGKVPVPGPQNGRYASEPKAGLTSLKDFDSGQTKYNASAQLAVDIGETVKRIDGTEVPILAPWRDKGANHAPAASAVKLNEEAQDVRVATPAKPAAKVEKAKPAAKAKSAKAAKVDAPADTGTKPEALSAPRDGGADNLKEIKGVGPKLEKLLNSHGIYHFDQIANWSDKDVAWADNSLVGFKGRVSRDNWVEQARILAEGGETEFSKRVDDGDVY